MGAGGATIGGVLGALGGFLFGAALSPHDVEDREGIERYRQAHGGLERLDEDDVQARMVQQGLATQGVAATIGAVIGAAIGAAVTTAEEKKTP